MSAIVDSVYPDSYYTATANDLHEQPTLTESLQADVCVIGAGFTGLSTALHLAEAGYRVVVLEANRVAWGASGRNGGQIGSGQRQDQEELEQRYGATTAHQLWELAEEAKATVKGLVARHAIDCDLQPGVLWAAHKARHVPWLQRYAQHLASEYRHPHAQALTGEELRAMLASPAYHGGLLDMTALHLHPLNFALGLARAARAAGVRIFEHSRVTTFSLGRQPVACTHQGNVRAEHLVIACNGYLGKLAPTLAGRIMPINNFMVATEPLGEAAARALIRDNVAVCDTRFVVNYFRLSADHRLLFGGGENYSRRFPNDIRAFVRPHLLQVFPQLAATRLDYGWGGTLAITISRLPSFGRLDSNTYYALGFSGHGVGTGTLAGKLMAEAVAGTAERFDQFARLPQVPFPGGTLLRWPALVLGMLYYGLRDRL